MLMTTNLQKVVEGVNASIKSRIMYEIHDLTKLVDIPFKPVIARSESYSTKKTSHRRLFIDVGVRGSGQHLRFYLLSRFGSPLLSHRETEGIWTDSTVEHAFKTIKGYFGANND